MCVQKQSRSCWEDDGEGRPLSAGIKGGRRETADVGSSSSQRGAAAARRSIEAAGDGPVPLNRHAVPVISRELSLLSHLSFPQVGLLKRRRGLPAERGEYKVTASSTTCSATGGGRGGGRGGNAVSVRVSVQPFHCSLPPPRSLTARRGTPLWVRAALSFRWVRNGRPTRDADGGGGDSVVGPRLVVFISTVQGQHTWHSAAAAASSALGG